MIFDSIYRGSCVFRTFADACWGFLLIANFYLALTLSQLNQKVQENFFVGMIESILSSHQ